jgi:pimeloyl-ACP methyl ester carboxylesterase
MAKATVDGLTLAYDVIGESGRPWIVTPGGRYAKDDPGVRELAEAIAASGDHAVIWDRPNCGDSDVCFDGRSESEMQADYLAALLRHLDLGPAVVMGGSGGARVSMLAVAAHPDIAAGLAVLWISGGIYGLMTLANFYCAPSLRAAWTEGMRAVADLPDWEEVTRRNPANRQRILEQDRATFIATMERWMAAYYPKPDEPVPGFTEDRARTITVPTLVFRSGESDCWHTRATSEAVAQMIPTARLVEPPWPDTEWIDGSERRARGEQKGAFERWPMLAPQLLEWATETLR